MRGAVVGTLGLWVAAAAALVAGAVGGVLLSMARADPGRDVTAPVPAVSPSVPVDPPLPLRPDTESAALQPGLKYVEQTIGANGFEIPVVAPRDWLRIDTTEAEAKWVVPGNRRNTFLLRIEKVSSQNQTIDAIKSQRIADLKVVTEDFRLVHETDTSIQIVYVDNGLTRYGNLRWIKDPDSSEALVEIAANGRERDEVGLLDMVIRVGNGIEARLGARR
ncbi:hypothetical protein [Nocardioides sp. LHG3406-4]|uniref:hypothetical protein n=1 Tax=Nocardioides sp. LHG3406-4 TaxID=2804575 RepID=UPI003CF81F44